MNAMQIDTRIINQYFFVGIYEGDNEADILQTVANHLRADPSKPTVSMVSFTPGKESVKAEVHFHLKKE